MNSEPQSFTGFLEAYGDAFPPAMRFDAGVDFSAWRTAFLKRVRELLGPVPERTSLSVQTLETTQCDDHVRHDLRIKVSAFSTLPAYLLVPADLQQGEKRGGILALHGHTQFGRDTVVGMDNAEVRDKPYRAYGLDAVRAGYVVLAPAWWGFSGRDGDADKLHSGQDKCNTLQMAASMYGVNILALHIQEGQAALDALSQRPEVDAARLGCIGNSYGGRTAMWIAALDDRVAATVASGCMNTFRERSVNLRSCAIQCPPGLLRYGDVADVFSTIAPRALQLMTGKEDPLMNASDVAAIYATVAAAYRSAGAGHQLDTAPHPLGHRMVWDTAMPFLSRHLPLTTSHMPE